MNKEQKISSILDSLDGIERAAPRPFFYTRLRARMENATDMAERVLHFISRPAVGIAAVLLIIVINAFAIYLGAPVKGNESASANTTEIASVDEYSQVNMTFFDIEK